MYSTETLSSAALKDAEDITLRELLESPTFQAWAVSAIGNASRFRHQFKGTDSHLDEYLQFKIQRVINQVTHEQKVGLYQATNEIIKANKAQTQRRANASA